MKKAQDKKMQEWLDSLSRTPKLAIALKNSFCTLQNAPKLRQITIEDVLSNSPIETTMVVKNQYLEGLDQKALDELISIKSQREIVIQNPKALSKNDLKLKTILEQNLQNFSQNSLSQNIIPTQNPSSQN